MNGLCFDSGLNKPTAQNFLGKKGYLNTVLDDIKDFSFIVRYDYTYVKN